MYIWCWLLARMKLRAHEYIVIFLILMVTCSTYYLHWTHGPPSPDHEKYRFRKHVKVEAHQDVSEAIKDSPQTVVNPPLLQKQPTTDFVKPKEVPAEDTIVVAVPTHNRIGYVQLTSAALKGGAENVWIFDDKSSEYSKDELRQWYGTEHVWQSKKHLKADAMARHILEWFLTTKYDVLVLLDSDLLVSPNWLSKLRDGLRESTGLLSVYRSGAPKHKSSSCDAVLCRQPSMGNAGTVWRRALAKRMLSEMPARDGGFDWGWSEWCAKNKVPMEALKESAVLHIGMYGSWSHESSAEKSVGFPMDKLAADIRRQAETFLKGRKPNAIGKLNKQTNKHNQLQAIHINGGKKRIACDVPCFWPSSGGIIRTIKIDELDTTITMSMEGEQYYPSLKLSNRRKDHLIASTRFNSDIPMPYYHWPWTMYMDETPSGDDIWSKNFIQTPHIPFSKVKKAAVFIARNCGSQSNREDLVKSLIKLMPVDSVSSCLHNFDLHDTSKKGPMMQKYVMYFAFENQRIDDYITEKLWDTFRAGVLPVYFGAPNILEHVPEHSIVHVDDFTSREELAKHLKNILSNETLYNSYHAWRYKPLPDWFVRKYNFTHVHSACRVCRWASAKLRKLSWDAEHFLKGAKPIIINKTPIETVHSDWQSYITSTEHSQTDIKTLAYDSRNIWASPDTCKHAGGTPERPTALFDQWSSQVCSNYPEACTLFKKAFVDTWDNGITWLKDGTVFLVTGDIPLMWLRDSSAQVTHYLALVEHSSIQRLIEGVLRRQMKWIELDVYGSAFRMFLDFDHVGKTRLTDWDFKCGRTIHVAQHDYEMDSLAYVVRLAYQYWKKTGRTCWMQTVQKTWHRIVDMWILEQDHSKSTYTYPTLENNGKGTSVCKTGMSWAGMRPSDDKMKYHYNIPGQLFAAKALEYMEEMSSLWSDDTLKQKASKLRLEIMKGVEKYGVVDGVLAYETDGCGHHLMADDANIPSLLSLPYLDIHRPEYEKTRLNILSDENPWWSKGGIGSPHTNGRGHPWHLAMIMEGWEDRSTLERVLKTAYGGSLHESVTMTGGSTRKWFGWANALFSEWLMQTSDKTPLKTYQKTARNHYLNGLSASTTAKLEYDALKRLESISSPCPHYRFPKAIQLEGTTLTTTSIGTSLHLASDEQKEAILNVDEQVNCILAHLKQAKVRQLDIKCGNMGVENGILKMLDFDISSMDHNPLSLVLKKMDDEFMDDAKYEAFVIQKFNTCINERKKVNPPKNSCDIDTWVTESNCQRSLYNDNYVCAFEHVGIEPTKVQVSSGMENTKDVMGRNEMDEYPTFMKGAFYGKSPFQFKPTNKNQNAHLETDFSKYDARLVTLIDSYTVKDNIQGQLKTGKTLAIMRHNYANPWWTINEVFLVWLSGVREVDHILFLDGHSKSSMDELWTIAFGGNLMSIGNLKSPVIFEKLYVVSDGLGLNSPLSPDFHSGKSTSKCQTDIFEKFVTYILRDISPVSEKMITLIDRKAYVRHPRGKTMPRVWNNCESEENKLRQAGYNVKRVRLESLSIREQLEQIRATSTLISVHGAGLAWLLFLPSGSKIIEAVPSSRANRRTFETASTWRQQITYERIPTKNMGNDKYDTDIIKHVKLETSVDSQNIGDSQNIQYDIPGIKLPHFISEKDKHSFLKYNGVDKWTETKFDKTGAIKIIQNGAYDFSDDCGWKSDYLKHKKYKTKASKHYKALIPLVVHGSNSFQHFLDGVMPKLMQAYELIQSRPDAVIIMNTNDIVSQLIRKLGITNKIENKVATSYTAEELFLICKTPPISKALWEKARVKLGVDKNFKGEKVILIKRTRGNSNGKRLINNYEAIKTHLKSKFGENFVTYDSTQHTLETSMELFQNARIIVGSHGGGMYNLLFAPSNTKVIEYMPTRNGRALGPAPNIIWIQSSILEQDFWRVSVESTDGNVNIDEKTLDKLVEQSKSKHNLMFAIPSVLRPSETLCKTVGSIIATTEKYPVLIHRRGALECEHFSNPRVIIKHFEPHTTDNDNQKKDYLALFDDIETFEDISYVMFLDDDVRICDGFSLTFKQLMEYPFLLGHFGRGGSGVVLKISDIPDLTHFVASRPNNIDSLMLRWALRYRKECSLRPQKIQMEHIGKISSIDRRPRGGSLNIQWDDHDTCDAPANNHDFQAMSETPSEHFWSEYCIHSHCAPFGSSDNCKTCLDGYKGDDCGIPDDGYEYKRKPNAAPIVLLSNSMINSSPYINLHIIGEQLVNKDVAYNVWHRKESAREVWSHMSKLSFPVETRVIDSMLSEPELWLLKYYESGSQPNYVRDISLLPINRISQTVVSNDIVKTSDLFAAIDYNVPENKGPWKQGWDYDYDGRFKDGLTVHIVPHSHNDPGWIKTYHTYYSTQTKHILDTVVAALTEDPRRTFIWAEISYFSLWWDDASQQQKEQAKRLVVEKRLDFVTGGWVMNDEASVTARATRWHLQEGREWLQKTFGVTPQYSWAIDPFGHSAGQAQVLKELGYKGMLIQRVHYAVKKQLAQNRQLEFQWQTPAGEIFTHMMPFYSYDGPHTCGPDPSVCCQFDFARISGYGGCPWHKPSVPITDSNVAERSKLWLDQVYKKAMLYRGKHVLVPVGDDFRYQTMDEAHKQFTNYQRMFDWIKVNVPAVSISFSTLTRYLDAVRETNVPKLQGSFFPYSDRVQDYWTGYFNSRIFYKGYDRLLESLIAAVESKCPTVDIHLQKRALGIFQHHDGITGTAKSHVVQDYYQTMQKAVAELKSKLKICLDIAAHVIVNPLSVDTPTMKANEIRPYEQDKCVSEKVQFENIKINEHGRISQINGTPVHESLVWRSNKPGQGVAGAYLMSVTSKEDVLQAKTWTTCVANRYKQVETTFDMLKRRIRVYNDGTIEFIYDVDIHARNNGELWAVYKPEWLAERLCSDVHGLTWECHTERKDAPLQAKFWPMPTMAWLASSSQRMTFTGAQPTGVGFHEGAMVLMLDRRGDKDDARGLGQGVTDSRPVEMRFGVLMETESLKEKASGKALSVRNWMLNPEIEIVVNVI